VLLADHARTPRQSADPPRTAGRWHPGARLSAQARRWHGGYGGLDDYLLNQALGALPGVFGIHVGQLAVRYGIDVEDWLASILPAADEEP
jgi:hypothetical protein